MSGRKKPPLGVRAKEWGRRSDSASKRRRTPAEDDLTDDIGEADAADDRAS